MKDQSFTSSGARIGSRLLLASLALLLGSSCVSQDRYDELVANAEYYQRLYQDLESFQRKLEAENAGLQGELALLKEAGESPIEAAFAKDIDERMARLQGIAAGLSASPDDVTILPVEGGYGYRLKDEVLFDSGSAAILDEGQSVLKRVATDIGTRSYERIWVRGHTDSDPVKRKETLEKFPHGNLQLSSSRAIEVAAFLIAEGGLDASRVIVAGFGSVDPVAKNDSSANKRRNRRVEIFVIEEPTDESDG